MTNDADRSRQEPRRNRELQDYSERFAGRVEPRISRRDEGAITDEVRRKEAIAAGLADAELAAEQDKQLVELECRIVHALTAIDKVRELLAGDHRSEPHKSIDHHCRRLRAVVAGELRRDRL